MTVAYSPINSHGGVRMRAVDVMTPDVIAVQPDFSVQALASLLSERGISGVPVVDSDERLVGIVSEGDLLHRAETGTERRLERQRSRWIDTIASDEDLAREYVKSHGRKVKDVRRRTSSLSPTRRSSPMWQCCSRRKGSNGSPSFVTARLLGSSAGRTSCAPWRRPKAIRRQTSTATTAPSVTRCWPS